MHVFAKPGTFYRGGGLNFEDRIGIRRIYLDSQARFDGRFLYHNQCDLKRLPVSAAYRTALR